MRSAYIVNDVPSRHGNVVKSKIVCRPSDSSSTCRAQDLDKSHKLVDLCHTMKAGLMVARSLPPLDGPQRRSTVGRKGPQRCPL